MALISGFVLVGALGLPKKTSFADRTGFCGDTYARKSAFTTNSELLEDHFYLYSSLHFCCNENSLINECHTCLAQCAWFNNMQDHLDVHWYLCFCHHENWLHDRKDDTPTLSAETGRWSRLLQTTLLYFNS